MKVVGRPFTLASSTARSRQSKMTSPAPSVRGTVTLQTATPEITLASKSTFHVRSSIVQRARDGFDTLEWSSPWQSGPCRQGAADDIFSGAAAGGGKAGARDAHSARKAAAPWAGSGRPGSAAPAWRG